MITGLGYSVLLVSEMVDFIPLRFKGPGEIPDGTERCFRPTARESSLPLAEDGKRRTRTSFPITDQKKSVICPCDKRKRKNRRLCERLTQCFTFEAGNALLNAALVHKDERMLLEVQGVDVIVRKVLLPYAMVRPPTGKLYKS